MNYEFQGPIIKGIQLVIPSNEIAFDDEISNYNFTPQQSEKLKNIMGYDRRRVVKNDVTSSDLIVAGFKELVCKGFDLSTLDALIVVTQTPDYLIPGTSYVVHGLLNMHEDILCLDINQGCAGYIVGLITAFSLLAGNNFKKIALVNVDVVSRLVSAADRNSRPIIGDAAAITILENNPNGLPIFGSIKVNGGSWDALMVPAGGMKIRPSKESSIEKLDSSGNGRSSSDLVMKGDLVFNFVMQEVPPMISELLKCSGVRQEAVDSFLFHQPNPFMLKKLSEKIGVGLDRMPINLVSHYGNSSGASIPAVLCANYNVNYFQKKRLVCLAGFGVGLTWGSILMPMHKLSFLNILEV
jgi:3-oxoacyl-[acyl-carrier-protein] synthase-3